MASRPPSSSLPPSTSDNTNIPPVQTATWIRYLPESFGIRAAIAASPYRWCARESALWATATGTAMTLHRMRMQPQAIVFAVNVGFGTTAAVLLSSYYFCCKKRDYQERMIEIMMQYNTFEPVEAMPEQVPLDENHPFMEPNKSDGGAPVEYFGVLEERKEWQAQLPSKDPSEVFRPTKDGGAKR